MIGQKSSSDLLGGFPGIPHGPLEDLHDAFAQVMDAGDDQAHRALLSGALTELAREAHMSGMLPERVVIGLRGFWRSVRQKHPLEDETDPLWTQIVGMALDCYERERPR